MESKGGDDAYLIDPPVCSAVSGVIRTPSSFNGFEMLKTEIREAATTRTESSAR